MVARIEPGFRGPVGGADEAPFPPCSRALAGWVRVEDGVVVRVLVGLKGLADLRVDRQELPGGRVVVTGLQVDEACRVGVAACESERGGRGEAARTLRVPPGVVVSRSR